MSTGKRSFRPRKKGQQHRSKQRLLMTMVAIALFTLITLPTSIQPSVAQVSPGCGIPGNDGNGTLLTGVVNTYFPPGSSGTLSPGATQMQAPVVVD
ncbi:MAG: hypothetical protein AAF329_28595, partial [Cyanobacteria bacterium P01_A01_bin.17]